MTHATWFTGQWRRKLCTKDKPSSSSARHPSTSFHKGCRSLGVSNTLGPDSFRRPVFLRRKTFPCKVEITKREDESPSSETFSSTMTFTPSKSRVFVPSGMKMVGLTTLSQ